jgi:hypothetical protein
MDRTKIEFDLIKLIGGERLMRFSYPPLGLALEKKLDPKQAVVAQKEQLLGVFEAALTKAELTAA